MRWLGLLAGVVTLTAVILNIFWFQRFAGISPGALLRLSVPTVLLLVLFISGVFLAGRLSARLMVRTDEEGDQEGNAMPKTAPSPQKPDDPSGV